MHNKEPIHRRPLYLILLVAGLYAGTLLTEDVILHKDASLPYEEVTQIAGNAFITFVWFSVGLLFFSLLHYFFNRDNLYLSSLFSGTSISLVALMQFFNEQVDKHENYQVLIEEILGAQGRKEVFLYGLLFIALNLGAVIIFDSSEEES